MRSRLIGVLLSAIVLVVGDISTSCLARSRKLTPSPRRASAVLGGVLQRFPLNGNAPVSDLEWSPDGRVLAVAREGAEVMLLPSRKVVHKHKGWQYERETRLCWSRDGRRLATLGDALRIDTLATGKTEDYGENFISIASLPSSLTQGMIDPPEFICVYNFPLLYGVTVVGFPRLLTDPEDKWPIDPMRLNTQGVISALSPDARVVLTRRVETVDFATFEHGGPIVWRVRLRDGKILWHRSAARYTPEAYSIDRVVWSEQQQGAAVTFTTSTEGSTRALAVVTRSRTYDCQPPRYTPPWVLKDPAWLGDQVLFVASGSVRRGARRGQFEESISSFQVPAGRYRVFVSGAYLYSSPAVPLDGTRLAYAEGRGRYVSGEFRGRWTVIVRAVQWRALARGRGAP
jgi:hypothetical protein